MNLKVIDTEFSVCKVEDCSQVDLNEEFVFAGHTDEELSLVCPTSLVPDNTTECNDGIFAISTFNTDYILIKDGDFEKAIEVLQLAGYTITKYHKTTL